MSFIYHGVPEKMIGDVLQPLNVLKSMDQNIYNSKTSKYKGREEVMQQEVQILNCRWGDVLNCLPFHPQKIFDLQKQMGLIQKVEPYRFYEIDTDKDLDIKKAVIFFKTAPGTKHISFKPAIEVDLEALDFIPEATIAYYRTLVGTGQMPFNYQFVPHFLYQGSINTKNLKVVTLST